MGQAQAVRVTGKRPDDLERLRQAVQGLRMLEQACLTLSRVSQPELALVFVLLADQHLELRRSLLHLTVRRGRALSRAGRRQKS